jgi:hypothetical protein
MERKNMQDDGLDPFAKGVAELIGDYAASATAGGTGPGSFTPLAVRVMRTTRQRDRAKRLVAASVFLVVGAVGLSVARLHFGDRQREALTYTVNGQRPSYPGYIEARAGSEPVLSFSDGTRVALEPRARGRVVELGRRGARIALEEGKAHVEVAHRPGAEWLFEAGPFLIKVHGTAFSYGWNASEARLDVKMDSGVVSVTGPLSGGEIFLRAGQTLSISLNDQGTDKADPGAASSPMLDGAANEAPTRVAGSPEDSLASGDSLERSVRPTVRSRFAESWVAKLADGEAAAVVADAERRGLAKVLDSSNSEELAALADASRFERRDGLARRALMAQRRRFPRSMRAGEASFLLGRLDEASEASDDGAERALKWYDRYLEEAPEGAYVSEALGHKMMVLEWTHRQAEATKIAKDYLRRFPGGTYSHAAKALARSP